jgi:hypothetical protein
MVVEPCQNFGPGIALLYHYGENCCLQIKEGDLPMEWIRRVFNVPATETQMGIVLGFCIFVMSVMSVVLVWQAQVIARQNAVIHMIQSRFGS